MTCRDEPGNVWMLLFAGPEVDSWSVVDGPAVGVQVANRRAGNYCSPDLLEAKLAGPLLDQPNNAGCLWAMVMENRHGEEGFNIRRDDDPTYDNPGAGCVYAFGDGDDMHEASVAFTDGERAAETLLWLFERAKECGNG